MNDEAIPDQEPLVKVLVSNTFVINPATIEQLKGMEEKNIAKRESVLTANLDEGSSAEIEQYPTVLDIGRRNDTGLTYIKEIT